MKKVAKGAVALALFVLLTFGSAGAVAFAQPDMLTAGNADLTGQSGGVPASFDLRDVYGVSYVTSVKNQRPFNTCWGFAATSAAETSILGQGLVYEDINASNFDLSEKQLAYFAHTHINDPTSSQDGEGMYSVNEGPSADIDNGGGVYLATNTYAMGIGPVLESRGEPYEYHGTGKVVAADGTSYSADDDWTLGEAYRFQQDYILKESYLLPSPAGTVANADGTTTYSYDATATEVIKKQLWKKCAVAIGYYADASRPWDTGGEGHYMSAKTWAAYTYEYMPANHGVTIVGWDDGFKKENFCEGEWTDPKTGETHTRVRPPDDGAWLVKNSWGAGTNKFPYRGDGTFGIPATTVDEQGKTQPVYLTDDEGNVVVDDENNPVQAGSGYFWLSYYDQSIVNPEVLIFDTVYASPNSVYEFDPDDIGRDQYDLMPANTVTPYEVAEPIKEANIFTADESKSVIAISYEIAKPNTTVSYEVYLLAPDYESPEDGVLVDVGERTYEYGGFYMEYLRGLFQVQEGQSYSVIVTQQTQEGAYSLNASGGYGQNSLFITAGIMNQYAKAVVNPGESMLYRAGTWHDWSDENLQNEVYQIDPAEDPFDMEFDNFPIKGYSLLKDPDVNVRLADGVKSVLLYVGDDPTTLALELFGDHAADKNIEEYAFDWRLAEGGDALVSLKGVDASGHVTLSGLKAGKTRLVMEMYGIGTLIIPVEVRERPAPVPEPEPEPSTSTDEQDTPKPQPQPVASTKASSISPKVSSTAPNTGDVLAPWQAIVAACTAAVIAFAAGMLIRRSNL